MPKTRKNEVRLAAHPLEALAAIAMRANAAARLPHAEAAHLAEHPLQDVAVIAVKANAASHLPHAR